MRHTRRSCSPPYSPRAPRRTLTLALALALPLSLALSLALNPLTPLALALALALILALSVARCAAPDWGARRAAADALHALVAHHPDP